MLYYVVIIVFLFVVVIWNNNRNKDKHKHRSQKRKTFRSNYYERKKEIQEENQSQNLDKKL